MTGCTIALNQVSCKGINAILNRQFDRVHVLFYRLYNTTIFTIYGHINSIRQSYIQSSLDR